MVEVCLLVSEIFNVESGEWYQGPALPRATADAKMTKVDGDIYHIGGRYTNRDIYRLDKNGSSIKEWKWTLVGKLQQPKFNLGVVPFKFNPKNCMGWL